MEAQEHAKKIVPKLYVDRWDGDLIPTPARQVVRNISLQEINHNQRLEFALDKARREGAGTPGSFPSWPSKSGALIVHTYDGNGSSTRDDETSPRSQTTPPKHSISPPIPQPSPESLLPPLKIFHPNASQSQPFASQPFTFASQPFTPARTNLRSSPTNTPTQNGDTSPITPLSQNLFKPTTHASEHQAFTSEVSPRVSPTPPIPPFTSEPLAAPPQTELSSGTQLTSAQPRVSPPPSAQLSPYAEPFTVAPKDTRVSPTPPSMPSIHTSASALQTDHSHKPHSPSPLFTYQLSPDAQPFAPAARISPTIPKQQPLPCNQLATPNISTTLVSPSPVAHSSPSRLPLRPLSHTAAPFAATARASPTPPPSVSTAPPLPPLTAPPPLPLPTSLPTPLTSLFEDEFYDYTPLQSKATSHTSVQKFEDEIY
eukprot:Phypoly_transcript_05531.p1 GENE.Phypoly_transcript_05531~~Phypoly_transcript_05531.p1  ORF type:complete len:427 (+),score=103.01 Phypoly_transcript_05531:239-1519(+)